MLKLHRNGSADVCSFSDEVTECRAKNGECDLGEFLRRSEHALPRWCLETELAANIIDSSHLDIDCDGVRHRDNNEL